MTKLSFGKPHKNVVNGNDIRKMIENIKPTLNPTLEDINNLFHKLYGNSPKGDTIWIDATTCVCIPPNASKEECDAAFQAVCEHPKMVAKAKALEKLLDSQNTPQNGETDL